MDLHKNLTTGFNQLPQTDQHYVVGCCLVGGCQTILKNMKVNVKDDIPYIMDNKKCLKPPTSCNLDYS